MWIRDGNADSARCFHQFSDFCADTDEVLVFDCFAGTQERVNEHAKDEDEGDSDKDVRNKINKCFQSNNCASFHTPEPGGEVYKHWC